VSPKQADQAVRIALIEAAARLIATEGNAGLTLRRVAEEVGTSTMAVYTHFGGMAELRAAVRREGFARLRDHLGAVENTRDPMADLVLLGSAYFLNAVTNPNLYRVMFMEPLAQDEADVGVDTFDRLVDGVRRCIDGDRLDSLDPEDVATQLWALAHGAVALHLAGLLDADQAVETSTAASRALLLAYGDDERMLKRSFTRARERLTQQS